jgi:hypothetical protein
MLVTPPTTATRRIDTGDIRPCRAQNERGYA